MKSARSWTMAIVIASMFTTGSRLKDLQIGCLPSSSRDLWRATPTATND